MPTRRIAACIVALACSLFVSLTAIAESHVRIVHLSYIDGDAQVNTGAEGAEFTHAVLNMPMTEGMWLYTPKNGRAEVRFENGSTVRVINDSEIQFSKLALADSGGKLETITIDHGTAYLNFDKLDRNDRVIINVGGKDFTLMKGSRMRVQADKKVINIALFKGEASIPDANGVPLKGGESLRLGADDAAKATLSNQLTKLDTDNWNKERDGEVDALVARSNRSTTQWPDTYTYEMSSLGAYGNFFDVPGYGTMWQPFGMGMGWNPYMDGLWGMYPGIGYTWISPYAWGWAPYRYGSWQYMPSYGWAWAPGTNFSAWNVGPAYTGTMPAGFRGPVTPVVGNGVRPAQLVVVGHPTGVHPSILAGKFNAGSHRPVSPVLREEAKAGTLPNAGGRPASGAQPAHGSKTAGGGAKQAGSSHSAPAMHGGGFGGGHMGGGSQMGGARPK